jgi:hypothetical protein
MWGILLVYNLVRLEMERLATELDVAPTRISFVAALREFAAFSLLGSKTLSPGASIRAGVPAGGQDQDEQLRPQAAGYRLVDEDRQVTLVGAHQRFARSASPQASDANANASDRRRALREA